MNRTPLAAALVLALAALVAPLAASAQNSDLVGVKPVPVPEPTRPVPEPAALALFAAGFGVVALAIGRGARR